MGTGGTDRLTLPGTVFTYAAFFIPHTQNSQLKRVVYLKQPHVNYFGVFVKSFNASPDNRTHHFGVII